MDKSIWYNASIALLVMTIVLGVITVWQVSLFAPRPLVYFSLVIFITYLALLAFSLRRVRWAFLANAFVAIIVLLGTFSSRTHFEFSGSPALTIPAIIVFVSIPLQVLLAVTSFKAYLALRRR